MGENTPYGMNESGIRLAVRLTPKAGRAGIRGIARTADGGCDDAAKIGANRRRAGASQKTSRTVE